MSKSTLICLPVSLLVYFLFMLFLCSCSWMLDLNTLLQQSVSPANASCDSKHTKSAMFFCCVTCWAMESQSFLVTQLGTSAAMPPHSQIMKLLMRMINDGRWCIGKESVEMFEFERTLATRQFFTSWCTQNCSEQNPRNEVILLLLWTVEVLL